MLRASALLIASLLLAACSGTAASLQTPAPSRAPTTSAATPAAATNSPAGATATPGAADTEAPTAAPPDSPSQYRPGDPIVLTSDGADWARITVSKVKAVASFKGAYYTDKPKVKGDVFIEAYIAYEALDNGVDYNPFDWQVFANGEAVDNFAFVMNGPEPQLDSGTLPKGRKAAGWVVYEVPAKGEVLLSYQGNAFSNDAPAFEVKLR